MTVMCRCAMVSVTTNTWVYFAIICRNSREFSPVLSVTFRVLMCWLLISSEVETYPRSLSERDKIVFSTFRDL